MRATAIALFLTFCIALVPSIVLADEAPHTPRMFSADELIVTERFQQAPIAFPWDVTSTDRIAQQNRLDFELILDVPFDTLRENIEMAYQQNQEIFDITPGALRYAKVDKLRVFGIETSHSSARISVGHRDLQSTLIVDLEPDGNRTRAVILNTLRMRQFAGFVPPRVGFLPAGAQEISFRWN